MLNVSKNQIFLLAILCLATSFSRAEEEAPKLIKSQIKETAGTILLDAYTIAPNLTCTTCTVTTVYFVDGTTQTTAAKTYFSGLQRSTTTVSSATHSTTSSTFQSTAYQVTITPTSATSRIQVTFSGAGASNNAATALRVSLFRGTTNLGGSAGSAFCGQSDAGTLTCTISLTVIDSPATTSATTYIAKFSSQDNTNTVELGLTSNAQSYIIAEEISQ